jgi:N-acetylneuraminate lyase
MRLQDGLVSAVFTPFDSNGELDLRAIETYAEHAARTRLAGVFVCGTTGEGPSLSTDERLALARRWVEVAPDELPVIVHVGHASIAEARVLAADAQRVGAHAVASVSPSYFRPTSAEPVARWCAQVAAAAPEIGFYYYHIPAVTGVNVPPDQVLRRLIELAPNIAGIKFTHEDLAMFERCRSIGGDARVALFGRDEMFMAALSMGFRGGVGSTFNYLAEGFTLLMEQATAGDTTAAARTQAILNRAIDVVRQVGNLAVAKAMMSRLGVPCGDPRLPLMPVSPEAVEHAWAARAEAYARLELKPVGSS